MWPIPWSTQPCFWIDTETEKKSEVCMRLQIFVLFDKVNVTERLSSRSKSNHVCIKPLHRNTGQYIYVCRNAISIPGTTDEGATIADLLAREEVSA